MTNHEQVQITIPVFLENGRVKYLDSAGLYFHAHIFVRKSLIVKLTNPVVFVNNPDPPFFIAIHGTQVIGRDTVGVISVVLEGDKFPTIKSL